MDFFVDKGSGFPDVSQLLQEVLFLVASDRSRLS